MLFWFILCLFSSIIVFDGIKVFWVVIVLCLGFKEEVFYYKYLGFWFV